MLILLPNISSYSLLNRSVMFFIAKKDETREEREEGRKKGRKEKKERKGKEGIFRLVGFLLLSWEN